jgi:ATP-dependent helicase/nuclease subunit A
MNQWTKEQSDAIRSRGSNLLVSAAAGSGKTAVLIERIIRMVVQDQIDVNRLLVVTFTRAAAAEMRERTADALMKTLSANPDKEKLIRRQLSLLNQSSMMTFHSFCSQVIREHYYLINLDPAFRTADQTQMALMQQEAVDEALECHYQEKDPDFFNLVEMYCGNRHDQVLQEMIKNLYQFSQSQVDPAKWLSEQAVMFESSADELFVSQWVSTLLELTSINLEYALSLMDQAIECCSQSDGPVIYQASLRAERCQIDSLLTMSLEKHADFFNRIRDFSFNRLPACRGTNEQLREEARFYRDQAKKEIKKMQDNWFFSSLEMFAADQQEIAPSIKKLMQVMTTFEMFYQKKKMERNLLDFNDLEHRALKILRIQSAGDFYRNQFEAVFVDEYQDSNRVQEALISLVRRPDNVFMVGDVKQSIYRFRLAEPELFMQKYKQYGFCTDRVDKRIDLNRNFRSSRQIIEAVNTIFSQIMSEQLGEIIYDESVFLQYGEIFPETLPDDGVSVHLLEKKSGNAHEKNSGQDSDDVQILLEEWTDQEAEALLLSQQIEKLMTSDIYDLRMKRFRKIRYSDITILLRAPGMQATHFTEVLSKKQIPVYADQGTGFFDSVEIQLFMNLLKIIDNFQQDLPLLSVLRSPFGGFSIDDLTEIRLAFEELSYHEAFTKSALQCNDVAVKAQKFLDRLDHWRYHLRKMPLNDFLWWLLEEAGFYVISAALPGGRQRQANLRIFLKRASDFTASNDGGLFAFLSHLDKMKFSHGYDDGPAKMQTESDDAVRIMSIHKSKGLEFPVVIMAGLGRQFNRKDMQQPLLLHRTLGLGPTYANPVQRIKRNTLARISLKEKSRIENLSEEMRILYVGMTRAQQKLIMTGSVNQLQEKIKQWCQPFKAGKLMKAQHVLDWLGPVWTRLKDAEGLRELAGADPTAGLTNQSGAWSFNVWSRRQLLENEIHLEENHAKRLNSLLQPDDRQHDFESWMFDHYFHWQYPHRHETEMPGKISVSELLSEQLSSHDGIKTPAVPDLNKYPGFMEQEKTMTAAERGIIFHYVLQHLDLSYVDDESQIRQQLEAMKQKEMISEQEAKTIDQAALSRFFASAVGQRMRQAKNLQREWPFVFKKPGMETILVQGVIDCCFLEPDGWILIDFKTDVFDREYADEWKNKYRSQIFLYRDALEKLTEIPVSEMMLYSFHFSQAYYL